MRKLLLAATLVSIAGCSGGGTNDSRLVQLNGGLPVAETVNGTAVPQVLVDAAARLHKLDLSVPEQRAEVLRVLSNYVLLAEQAKREGWSANPPFAADIELARLTAVANATMAELEKQTPLTDDAVKADYDAQVARSGKIAYDFDQILFATEADALKAAGEVLGGKPFGQVYDIWKDLPKQAEAKVYKGLRAEQLPEPLRAAITALKDGETTRVPVKNQYGWLVIHLEASNPFIPPAFDQVKESIRASLIKKIGEQRLAKLKQQATIEYPPGGAPVALPGESDASPKTEPAKTPTPAPSSPAAAKKD